VLRKQKKCVLPELRVKDRRLILLGVIGSPLASLPKPEYGTSNRSRLIDAADASGVEVRRMPTLSPDEAWLALY
jgi:hypothetical protein